MKIPSFLRPILGVPKHSVPNQHMAATKTAAGQKSRLPYNLREGMKKSVISPKLTTAIELTSFALAIAALTAGVVTGIVPLIVVGALAFALPFVIAPFLTRSYY
jgi:hypothetical protein